jgi:hypothetical protein
LFHKIKHKEVKVVIPDIHSRDRNVSAKMDKKLGMIWQQFSGKIQNYPVLYKKSTWSKSERICGA